MEAPVVSQEKVEIFPCLEELFVWNCPKLRNAPCRFPSLKLLTIYYMHSSTPIENISSGLTTLTSLILNDIEEITCLPEGILKKNKNLTSLEIKNCRKLTCIAPDVLGCCPSLGSLVVSGCEKLRNLPGRLDTLPLQTLKINACRLKLIPITNGIVSLCKVEIKRCGLLSGLPSGLLDCSFLQELTTEMCHSLTSIPITQGLTYLHKLSIATCDGLSGPLSGLEYCASLQELYISECPKLTSIPTQGMSLSSLQVLRIGYCEDLTSFPALELCPSLRWLAVYWCRKLTSISISSSPTSNHLLQTTTGPELFTNASHSSFEDLSIEICINLQSIPALNSFPFLPKFTLGNCEKLQSLVSGIQMPVSVECLIIRGFRNLETLPSLHSRTSLRQLWISRCGKLKYLPTEIRCLTHLKDLRIGNYWEELDSFPDFQAPSQLESLDLYGWPKLKSLPQQVQHLSYLTFLEINSFDGVEALPEWLGNLTSLSTLRIMDCKNLKYLPSVKAMQGLTKLQSLWISQCPLLQDRCTRDSGPEWAKISHIPRISGI